MKPLYFTINLNKASNRLDLYTDRLHKRSTMYMASFIVILLAVAGVTFYFMSGARANVEVTRTAVANLEQQITELEASAEFIAEQDVFKLHEMVTQRIAWAKKLLALAEVMPKDMAFTEVHLDRGIMTIKGVSKIKPGQKDLDLVVGIIDQIRAHEELSRDFADVKFQLSNRFRHDEQEILAFEVACILK